MADKKVWSRGEILRMWPQAKESLEKFRGHLIATNAGVKALQLDIALQMAEAEFRRLEEGKSLPISRLIRKAVAILHHADPPCSTRLVNGFCPKCKLSPDTQSTCSYFYCPDCKVRLDKMICPSCSEKFKKG